MQTPYNIYKIDRTGDGEHYKNCLILPTDISTRNLEKELNELESTGCNVAKRPGYYVKDSLDCTLTSEKGWRLSKNKYRKWILDFDASPEDKLWCRENQLPLPPEKLSELQEQIRQQTPEIIHNSMTWAFTGAGLQGTINFTANFTLKTINPLIVVLKKKMSGVTSLDTTSFSLKQPQRVIGYLNQKYGCETYKIKSSVITPICLRTFMADAIVHNLKQGVTSIQDIQDLKNLKRNALKAENAMATLQDTSSYPKLNDVQRDLVSKRNSRGKKKIRYYVDIDHCRKGLKISKKEIDTIRRHRDDFFNNNLRGGIFHAFMGSLITVLCNNVKTSDVIKFLKDSRILQFIEGGTIYDNSNSGIYLKRFKQVVKKDMIVNYHCGDLGEIFKNQTNLPEDFETTRQAVDILHLLHAQTAVNGVRIGETSYSHLFKVTVLKAFRQFNLIPIQIVENDTGRITPEDIKFESSTPSLALTELETMTPEVELELILGLLKRHGLAQSIVNCDSLKDCPSGFIAAHWDEFTQGTCTEEEQGYFAGNIKSFFQLENIGLGEFKEFLYDFGFLPEDAAVLYVLFKREQTQEHLSVLYKEDTKDTVDTDLFTDDEKEMLGIK